MAKEKFLQIRLTEGDRERVSRVATAEHLDDSTWARRVIMLAVEAWEAKQAKKASRQRETGGA